MEFRRRLPWCFGCAITEKCVYKDGFDEFLRNTIQTADAFVYALHHLRPLHSPSLNAMMTGSSATDTAPSPTALPIAYLISGDYAGESNLRMIGEGRSEVGGNYLCGVATDEGNTAAELRTLADSLAFALEKKLSRPANFYGVAA